MKKAGKEERRKIGRRGRKKVSKCIDKVGL